MFPVPILPASGRLLHPQICVTHGSPAHWRECARVILSVPTVARPSSKVSAGPMPPLW
jgi:hypothetical protein